MAIALTVLAAIVVVLFALVVYGRASVRDRDRLLVENGYFLGRRLDEVIVSIGRFTKKYPRWSGRSDYVWDGGDISVLLICDGDDRVVDYCPPRLDSKAVLSFFQRSGDGLINQDVWGIKKSVGESHDFSKYDFGVVCDTWKTSGQTTIEVWSKNGLCTAVLIKT